MTLCWRIVPGLPVRRSLLEILICVSLSVSVSVIFGWSRRSHASFNHCKVRREDERAVLEDIDRRDTERYGNACNKYLPYHVWFFFGHTASRVRPRASYILEDMVGFRFFYWISMEERSEVLCSPGCSTRGKRNPKPSGQHVQLVLQHTNLEEEPIQGKDKKLTCLSSDETRLMHKTQECCRW